MKFKTFTMLVISLGISLSGSANAYQWGQSSTGEAYCYSAKNIGSSQEEVTIVNESYCEPSKLSEINSKRSERRQGRGHGWGRGGGHGGNHGGGWGNGGGDDHGGGWGHGGGNSNRYECAEQNVFGMYAIGGGCNAFGCYYPGGDCNAFGCYYEGGSCNAFGCIKEQPVTNRACE